MDPNQAALNPYAALMYRKAQLQAQEQAAMGQQPAPVQQPSAMPQAQFSGYPGAQQAAPQPMQGRPPMTPQQLQQLAALLQARQQ